MQQPSQPPSLPHKVQVKLISAEGTCPNGHKVGDEWIITRKTPEPGICLAAFCNLITPIRILETGGSWPMYSEPDSFRTVCPEKYRLTFEIRRLPETIGGPEESQRPQS